VGDCQCPVLSIKWAQNSFFLSLEFSKGGGWQGTFQECSEKFRWRCFVQGVPNFTFRADSLFVFVERLHWRLSDSSDVFHVACLHGFIQF
jgi:hypothetical protein